MNNMGEDNINDWDRKAHNLTVINNMFLSSLYLNGSVDGYKFLMAMKSLQNEIEHMKELAEAYRPKE